MEGASVGLHMRSHSLFPYRSKTEIVSQEGRTRMIFTPESVYRESAERTGAASRQTTVEGSRETGGSWMRLAAGWAVGAVLFGCIAPAPAFCQSAPAASRESATAASAAVTGEGAGAGSKATSGELPDAPAPVAAVVETGGSDTSGATLPASGAGGDELAGAGAGERFSDSREGWNGSLEPGMGSAVQPGQGHAYVELKDCPYDKTRARECRMHWGPMLISSSIFNAFENAGNLYTGYWYRYETMHGKWWDRYIDSAAGWRWDSWEDNNPAMDDYVGHPMMGAITNSIWIQNDPKGMTLELANNRPYWNSRMRALTWSTFYSFEWKLGPLGEASIGHNGDHYFYDKGTLTNETGWVELVTTPVGGLGWTVAEDYLDKHVVRSLEEKNRNPLLLTVYQFLTPARGFANILRFRPPWYRDSRIVKAQGFGSDPGEGLSASTQEAMKYASKHGEAGMPAGLVAVKPGVLRSVPDWEGPGGRHEFGAWWGVSLISGHLWGEAKDVKYMPIDLRYSYQFYRHKQQWALRYSPEMTALAMIDWPTPNPKASATDQRERVYGSGLSPVGFQWDFLPLRRVQPFFSTDSGFLYFSDRVLSPQGSQLMYTMDYGAGVNIFRHGNEAVTIGYRYQHLSNFGISQHNPGADASTFYVGVSRFRNRSR